MESEADTANSHWRESLRQLQRGRSLAITPCVENSDHCYEFVTMKPRTDYGLFRVLNLANETKDYDDERALSDYVSQHWRNLLPEDERLQYDAEQNRMFTALAPLTQADLNCLTESEQRLSDAAWAKNKVVMDGLRQRVWQLIMTGAITVNRCSQCSRIVRTPKAKQCLWCGHDWHET